MAILANLAARFPLLDPYRVSDDGWHEVPLSALQRVRLEESYGASRRRRWRDIFGTRCSGPHLWARAERGPWFCEHCTEERWTL